MIERIILRWAESERIAIARKAETSNSVPSDPKIVVHDAEPITIASRYIAHCNRDVDEFATVARLEVQIAPLIFPTSLHATYSHFDIPAGNPRAEFAGTVSGSLVYLGERSLGRGVGIRESLPRNTCGSRRCGRSRG